VPRDLETICLKCLQKQPDKRYPTALALGEDLRRFLEGKPIHARPVGALERIARWARRRPDAALLTVAVALGLTLGVPGWLWARWRYESELAEAGKHAALQEERRRAAERIATLDEERRRAAEEIAEAHRYHTLLYRAAEAVANRRAGWTFQGLKDLEEAGRLPTEARNLARLRSLAAPCLAGVDVRRKAVLAEDFPPY